MKKTIICISAICLLICSALFAFTSCGKEDGKSNQYDSVVKDAISTLKSAWEEFYEERSSESGRENEIRIVNTRIVFIKKDTDIELFQDIKYIVQFDIYSDYYGSDGKYFINNKIYDSVNVRKDGSTDCLNQDLIRRYNNITYDFSFPMIDKIVELGDRYNQTVKLDVKEE